MPKEEKKATVPTISKTETPSPDLVKRIAELEAKVFSFAHQIDACQKAINQLRSHRPS